MKKQDPSQEFENKFIRVSFTVPKNWVGKFCDAFLGVVKEGTP